MSPASLFAACAPAVRTVVIQAVASRDEATGVFEADHYIFPVLAITITVNPVIPQTQIGDVWHGYDYIVAVPGEGLGGQELLHTDDSIEQIVVCSWPQEDDKARLAPVIASLKGQVIAREEKKAAEEAKRPG